MFEHAAAWHVAACSSMLQPDMLPPVQACCSRTCCRLLEHVAAGHVVAVRACCSRTFAACWSIAGHVAACLSMLQTDMLPPVLACCSRTFAACWSIVGHVAACSSILQPDMLPHVLACCSRTCCHLVKHVAAGHLPPVQACCSRTFCCLLEHVAAWFEHVVAKIEYLAAS